jgi:hypothetical protein
MGRYRNEFAEIKLKKSESAHKSQIPEVNLAWYEPSIVFCTAVTTGIARFFGSYVEFGIHFW